MVENKKSQIVGITLFETLLVLVVMTIILIFSINQYLSFRRTGEEMALQANVDNIFNAMSQYYFANCNVSSSPLYNYYSAIFYPIDINNDLINNKYLNVPSGFMPVNPIVYSPKPMDSAVLQNGSYLLQFNQIQKGGGLPKRKVIGTYLNNTYQAPSTVTFSLIVAWQMQVAVKIQDTAHAAVYKNLLGAECLSHMNTNFVIPCKNASPSDNEYLVWTRLPSLYSSQANSPYWPSTPTTRLFAQMYSTDPALNIFDGTYTQYIRCGGGSVPLQ